MFSKYYTPAEAAERLSPYKLGDTFILKEDIRSQKGVFRKESKASIAKIVPKNKEIFSTIAETEINEYTAESACFYYTLEIDGQLVNFCNDTDFTEHWASPKRESYKKLFLLLVCLMWSSLIIVPTAFCASIWFLGTGLLQYRWFLLSTVISLIIGIASGCIYSSLDGDCTFYREVKKKAKKKTS